MIANKLLFVSCLILFVLHCRPAAAFGADAATTRLVPVKKESCSSVLGRAGSVGEVPAEMTPWAKSLICSFVHFVREAASFRQAKTATKTTFRQPFGGQPSESSD